MLFTIKGAFLSGCVLHALAVWGFVVTLNFFRVIFDYSILVTRTFQVLFSFGQIVFTVDTLFTYRIIDSFCLSKVETSQGQVQQAGIATFGQRRITCNVHDSILTQ